MSDLTTVSPTPSETPATSASGNSELADLKATVATLESQTHTLRVIVLIVIGALCLFFWREASYNGVLAAALQPQVNQINQFVAHLQKQDSSIEKQNQALQAAAMKLVEYGKTHPDYVPILIKYGLAAAPAGTAPAAAKPASVPAAATPAKK